MSTTKAIGTVAGCELIIVLVAVMHDGVSVTALQTITRLSGRLSLAIFSAIFLLSDKPEKLRPVLSERFYLVFAVAHGIHLVELLPFVALSGRPLVSFRTFEGVVAYVLIVVMPWIQSRYEARGISLRAFRRSHAVYLSYVWFFFFTTYLPRVQGQLPSAGGYYWEWVALFVWLLVMMAYKATTVLRTIPARSA
jgi:hypothetical protein